MNEALASKGEDEPAPADEASPAADYLTVCKHFAVENAISIA